MRSDKKILLSYLGIVLFMFLLFSFSVYYDRVYCFEYNHYPRHLENKASPRKDLTLDLFIHNSFSSGGSFIINGLLLESTNETLEVRGGELFFQDNHCDILSYWYVGEPFVQLRVQCDKEPTGEAKLIQKILK